MGCSRCLAAHRAPEGVNVVAPVSAKGMWWCSWCTCEIYFCNPALLVRFPTDDNDRCLTDSSYVYWLLM